MYIVDLVASDHSYYQSESQEGPHHEAAISTQQTSEIEKIKRALLIERQKVATLRKHLRKACHPVSKKKVMQELANFLDGPARAIVLSQLQNVGKSTNQCVWTNKMKMLCLTIHFHSPKAYQYLRKLLLLPCERTLQRCFEGVQLNPRIRETIIEASRRKVAGMSQLQKFCVVSFDEMAVKTALSYRRDVDYIEGFVVHGDGDQCSPEYANPALVFMASGMLCKWKQSIGYVFSNSSTPASVVILLQKFINRLFEIGLVPKLVICDQGLTNQSLVKSILKVNETNPFITICDENVFFMYDTPHLLKSTRNNLLNKDFYLDSNRIT